MTFGALLASIAVCSIAVVAGIGGGGMLVPLFATLLEVPMPVAVSLSQATICGQSCLNMAVQLFRKHPESSVRPVINYQYLSLILPLSLAGTLLGSAFSKIVPDWLRIAMLFTLLTTVLHRVIERAKRQFRADKIRTSEQVEMQKIEERPTREPQESFDQFPPYELGTSVLYFSVLLICNIIRSNDTECGSTAYLLLFVIPVSILCCGYLHARSRLLKVWADVSAGAVPPDRLTFHWNFKTTAVFPAIAVIAGSGATMLGIGGGLILSFVLFEAGLSPEEASASSGMATLLIATESAIHLYLQQQLPKDFGALFFFGGLLSAVVGQSIFIPFIKKNDWKFLIVAALGIIVGGSLIALTSYGIYDTVILLKHEGSLLTFGHFCKSM